MNVYHILFDNILIVLLQYFLDYRPMKNAGEGSDVVDKTTSGKDERVISFNVSQHHKFCSNEIRLVLIGCLTPCEGLEVLILYFLYCHIRYDTTKHCHIDLIINSVYFVAPQNTI